MESSSNFEAVFGSDRCVEDRMTEQVLEAQIQAACETMARRLRAGKFHVNGKYPRIRKRDSVEDFLIKQVSN
jgi:hypothetical protein